MTINLTILIQAIHFFIAYLIISKILLKPAISIIQEDQEERNKLLVFIKAKESEIKSKDFLRKSLWQNSLIQFHSGKPILEKLKIADPWKTPKPLAISPDIVLKIKKDLTAFIVDKVQHVE